MEWEAVIQCADLEGYSSDWEWMTVKGCVQYSWLGGLLCVSRHEGITIKVENPRKPAATKDHTIMSDIINAGYTSKTLCLLNKVRMA